LAELTAGQVQAMFTALSRELGTAAGPGTAASLARIRAGVRRQGLEPRTRGLRGQSSPIRWTTTCDSTSPQGPRVDLLGQGATPLAGHGHGRLVHCGQKPMEHRACTRPRRPVSVAELPLQMYAPDRGHSGCADSAGVAPVLGRVGGRDHVLYRADPPVVGERTAEISSYSGVLAVSATRRGARASWSAVCSTRSSSRVRSAPVTCGFSRVSLSQSRPRPAGPRTVARPRTA
jgi:hypothetical protein